jgi:hypothetical protein
MVALAAVSTGVEFTVTVIVFVPLQDPLLPVIVYVVVDPGLSVWVAPVSPPGFQVYDEAPVAVITVEFPAQIAAPLAVMVGEVFTVMTAVELAVQLPTLPVTVYVVVPDGVSVCVLPVSPPGFQV